MCTHVRLARPDIGCIEASDACFACVPVASNWTSTAIRAAVSVRPEALAWTPLPHKDRVCGAGEGATGSLSGMAQMGRELEEEDMRATWYAPQSMLPTAHRRGC